MRIHLLAVPHTITRSDFSHCAFTGKVQRFSPMMRAQGFEVLHYGVETSESGASEDVVLMTEAEHLELLGHPYHEQQNTYGDDAVEGTPLYRQWCYQARQELAARLRPGDVVACPFGRAHDTVIKDLPLLRARQAAAFESGIGYKDSFLPYRVYESEACRHSVMAMEGRAGVSHESGRLEWVVPNYYDPAAWPIVERPTSDTVVFLGRLGKPKGVDLIPRLAAERPDLTFILCGQGDPEPYLGLPNVRYQPPIQGAARAGFLGNARAIIAPSRYVEPFCGAVVEAALCGTPSITSTFGAFVETVEQGQTGFRCQTLRHWLDALDAVLGLDRLYVRDRAVSRYSLDAVGPQYTAVLADIHDNLVRP